MKRTTKKIVARQLNDLRREYLAARRRNHSRKAFAIRLYTAKHAELYRELKAVKA
jgi:hypothetical protein